MIQIRVDSRTLFHLPVKCFQWCAKVALQVQGACACIIRCHATRCRCINKSRTINNHWTRPNTGVTQRRNRSGDGGEQGEVSGFPQLHLLGPEDKFRWCARVHGHRAAESVISEILGKFQAGEGGGIFHAGAAVPARLTPSRLRSAAGGVEAPGSSRPASPHLGWRAQARKRTGLDLRNKSSRSERRASGGNMSQG